MSHKLSIAYFAHSVRSDWNNGNAHFLRGLLRSLGELGHDVVIFEPAHSWSIENLRSESTGAHSLQRFSDIYPDLSVHPYDPNDVGDLECSLKLNLVEAHLFGNCDAIDRGVPGAARLSDQQQQEHRQHAYKTVPHEVRQLQGSQMQNDAGS